VFLDSLIVSADPTKPNCLGFRIRSCRGFRTWALLMCATSPISPASLTIIGFFPDLPSFVYDRTAGRLGFRGAMNSEILSKLSGPLTVLVVDYHTGTRLLMRADTFRPLATHCCRPPKSNLFTTRVIDSQGIRARFQIGGPGQFKHYCWFHEPRQLTSEYFPAGHRP